MSVTTVGAVKINWLEVKLPAALQVTRCWGVAMLENCNAHVQG